MKLGEQIARQGKQIFKRKKMLILVLYFLH